MFYKIFHVAYCTMFFGMFASVERNLICPFVKELIPFLMLLHLMLVKVNNMKILTLLYPVLLNFLTSKMLSYDFLFLNI